MKRTTWFGGLTMLALLLGQGQAPSLAGGKDKKAAKGASPYVHCVIFYLKKDAPKGEAQALIKDADELLAKIPSVKRLRIGPPAKEHTPKYATTDYDIGLLVMFENYQGLTAYLEHKLHLEYVERHEKHLEKVLVYDFLQK